MNYIIVRKIIKKSQNKQLGVFAVVNKSKSNSSTLSVQDNNITDHINHHFQLQPIAKAVRLCVLGLGFGFVHSVSQAATISVTNDGDAGVGCTLREAITSLNDGILASGCTQTGSFGVEDTVTFSGSMAAGGSITLSAGQLNIKYGSEISIDASATSGVTIDANSNSRVFRLYSESYLSIDNLTITGGETGGSGGGVLGDDFSSLRVLNSTISSNTASNHGGGIYSNGNVYLKYSDVSSNTASTGNGGGITIQAAGGENPSGDKYGATVIESTISSNSATAGDGGGIHVAFYSGGEGGGYASSFAYFLGSTVTGNSAVNGGGVSADGSLIIAGQYTSAQGITSISNNVASQNGGGVHLQGGFIDGGGSKYSIFGSGGESVTNSVLTVSGNVADSDGGGIYVGDYAFTVLTLSTISNNAATTGSGGGIYIGSKYSVLDVKYSTIDSNNSYDGGGGIFVGDEGGEVSIDSSTVSNNLAGGDGAGLYSFGELTLTNSTVSGNTSTGGAWGGGGIYSGGEMSMSNSTITHNRHLGSVYNSSSNPAGVYSYGNEDITNSIIANSIGGIDCYSADYIDANSIVEDGSCSATRSGDPGLEANLRSNGGPTQTHLLQERSIAINTGDNSTCTGDLDQRGKSRLLTVADACDVGAVEFKNSDKKGFFVIPTKNGKVVVIPE